MTTRPPPHDLEAERAVLGALLMDETCFGTIADLSPADFYHPGHASILETLRDLRSGQEPTDVVTLAAKLRQRGRLNAVGGLRYLGELTEAVASVQNIGAYARIVSSHALRRREIDAAEAAAHRLRNHEPIETVWADLSKTFSAHPARGDQAATVGSDLDELFNTATARASGRETAMSTPWPALDSMLGGTGLWPGMYVLVGSTGSGKSQWAVQIATHAARRGQRALYLALELSRRDLAARVFASVAGISWSALLRGALNETELHRAISRAEREVRDLPLHTECGAPYGYGIEALVSRAWALRPQLVVLDYLQLCAGKVGEEPRVGVARVSYAARAIARDLGAVVIVLSSTARANYGELVNDPAKDPADLVGMGKESGEIEYAADGVLVLAKGQPQDDPTRRVLVLAKNRYGHTGRIPLRWTGVSFEDEHAPGDNARGRDGGVYL
ncbi:MAG: replicative DNA helicase [Deltaproteobacteria bacterium]|nr:replicative DNA helicase [Deltaproteobacteria bacterium]